MCTHEIEALVAEYIGTHSSTTPHLKRRPEPLLRRGAGVCAARRRPARVGAARVAVALARAAARAVCEPAAVAIAVAVPVPALVLPRSRKVVLHRRHRLQQLLHRPRTRRDRRAPVAFATACRRGGAKQLRWQRGRGAVRPAGMTHRARDVPRGRGRERRQLARLGAQLEQRDSEGGRLLVAGRHQRRNGRALLARRARAQRRVDRALTQHLHYVRRAVAARRELRLQPRERLARVLRGGGHARGVVVQDDAVDAPRAHARVRSGGSCRGAGIAAIGRRPARTC
jgi:hypothetical protein